MHRIILKTLQAFVVDTYGEDAWLAIQEAADIEEKVYVPVTVYPDGDVYEIARTAGELTDQSPRTILTQYGTADDVDPEAVSTSTPETIGDGRGESESR